MKKILFFIFFIYFFSPLYAQRVTLDECHIIREYGMMTRTFSAYGDVFVETDPEEPVDIEVKIVDNPISANLTVYRISSVPEQCGEWRFTKKREQADFTIRFVKEHEDVTIMYTSHRSEAGWNIVLRH